MQQTKERCCAFLEQALSNCTPVALFGSYSGALVPTTSRCALAAIKARSRSIQRTDSRRWGSEYLRVSNREGYHWFL